MEHGEVTVESGHASRMLLESEYLAIDPSLKATV
jgi:hypothetical protein